MKLGFIFNTKFIEYKGDFYSTNLTQSLFEKKYLRFFDEIVVIGRYISTDKSPVDKLVRSNSDKVTFKCIPDQSKITRILMYNKEKSFIEESLVDCDRVIIRGWRGAEICSRLKKTYMVESVSCAWDAYWNHSILGKMVALPNYLFQKKHTRKAPYVLYVSNEFLQKRYPTNGIAIGCSDVELPHCDENILITRINRIKQKTEKSHLIFATTAAVNVRYKGQKYVIQAMKKLKEKGYSCTYYLIGGGEQAYLKNIALKHGVQKDVVFLGALPHNQVFSVLDKVDIYIQPSLQEGLPRAVVEAMSRGCPVIGSSTGGTPELCNPKYIFENRNIDMLVKKIIEMNEELEEEAKRSFEMAKKFTEDILREKRDDFMEKFIDNQ